MTMLITGATGFLGGAVLAEALAGGPADRLLLLVRAAGADEGLRRIHEVLDRFEVPADLRRGLGPESILCGDLSAVGEFADDPRLDGVRTVVNCAALATFSNNPLLWSINVDGTFAFAERMSRVPGLQRFLHVGTAMACGPDLPSPIGESWAMPPAEEHLVPYTASKAEIERRMHRDLPNLPLVVARPSIVVGHTRLGCRPSGSIYWVFRMGRALEAFTCALSERIDLIPVDWCAQALLLLVAKPALAHDLYHVSAGSCSPRFEDIDRAVADGLGVSPVGDRYRVVDEADMRALVPLIEERLGFGNRRLILRALRLYGGFARLNYVFDNARLIAEGMAPPPPVGGFMALCAATSGNIPLQDQMAWDFK